MRDLVKSMFSLSMAMPILAMKQVTDLWRARGRTGSMAGDLDTITDAIEDRLGSATKALYDGGNRLQRKLVDAMFEGLPGSEATEDAGEEGEEEEEASTEPVVIDSGTLDTSTIVVLGSGLAAGFGDFSLSEEFQRESFGAQIAKQMGRELEQASIESPGIGNAAGFQRLPVQVPALMQTTTVSEFPPTGAPLDLSVPGFRVADAVNLRPAAPIVHQDDARQTAANLILGLPELLDGKKRKMPTQLERAVAHKPTLAVVELGFQEALEAAVNGNPAEIPEVDGFRTDYQKVVVALAKKKSQVLLLTIPNPVDTAFFSSLESAAANAKVEPQILTDSYGLNADDLVTVPALMEMGFQLLANEVGKLPENGIMKRAVAAEIGERVAALNASIVELAEEHGALVFDLAALVARVAERGVVVGGRNLTADFLGGFYLLNGYFPGATGHAVIANGILELLNRTFDSSFPLIETAKVMKRDPAADYRPAAGPVVAAKEFSLAVGAGATEVVKRERTPSAAARKSVKAGRKKAPAKKGAKLVLPAGLEQTLPINKESSYFGDAIRAANCRQEGDMMFGSGRELLFGGLAMVDSHISGEIRIKFSSPVEDVTHFEVYHDRLEGDDGTLAAPQFFKLPVLRNEVRDDSELVSSGDLDLATGEVSNLSWAVRFGNTALMALVRVNPKLPDIAIQFPGLYGSAWARFEQRSDGLLDFTFYGTTFLPLGGDIEGDTVRFPLPLCSPTLEFASIPARGTSLHPHLHLSTKEPEDADPDLVPEIPVNSVREYTIYTHNTAFGDKFTLHSEELSGDPTGRSQLLGRVQVQFGHPSGDSVPVAVSCLNPGGMLAPETPTPLADDFPGRLPPAPVGHNEFLRFATRTYFLDALTCIDDPFDVSVGNVSRKSGRFLTELLHRALIGQNLFYALLRVEPRTPKSSFHFRGPARFEKGKDGRTVFRFAGQVTVPYPEGYLFPSPDMATGVAVGPDSVLDPFYWVQAMEHDRTSDLVIQGKGDKVLSSTSEQFSYKYVIPGAGASRKPSFEYINHTVAGTFRLSSLSWVSFVNSRGAGGNGDGYDTVTFAGFGDWSKDESGERHLACVQISEAKDAPYVSIQIGGGHISNVNTKPLEIDDVRP